MVKRGTPASLLPPAVVSVGVVIGRSLQSLASSQQRKQDLLVDEQLSTVVT